MSGDRQRSENVSDLETRCVAAMRAADNGSTQSYAHLLSELAEVFRRFVARDLAKYGFSAVDAEDIVQEALLAIHVKRHTWQSDRPFLPWALAIVRHKLLDLTMRSGRAREVPLGSHAERIAELPSERIALAPIEQYLEELPPRQRVVVTALAIDGETVAQAAMRLKLRPGAVRVALHRGLAALAAKFGSRD